MNAKKAIALFVVIAAALLVFTVPVSAESDDSDVLPDYAPCLDCGGSIVSIGSRWVNEWSVIMETKCTHYTNGTDLVFEDRGWQNWQCSTGKRGDVILVTRTKTECHGCNLGAAFEDMEEVECTHYCYGTDLIAKDGTKDCHGFDPK